MLQTNLKVVAVGEPDVEALTDGEKRTFFESIFSRIVELHKQTQTENKNVKMPYVIQNREYYGLKNFRLIMRV